MLNRAGSKDDVIASGNSLSLSLSLVTSPNPATAHVSRDSSLPAVGVMAAVMWFTRAANILSFVTACAGAYLLCWVVMAGLQGRRYTWKWARPRSRMP
jgi:hypothetical protein